MNGKDNKSERRGYQDSKTTIGSPIPPIVWKCSEIRYDGQQAEGQKGQDNCKMTQMYRNKHIEEKEREREKYG